MELTSVFSLWLAIYNWSVWLWLSFKTAYVSFQEVSDTIRSSIYFLGSRYPRTFALSWATHDKAVGQITCCYQYYYIFCRTVLRNPTYFEYLLQQQSSWKELKCCHLSTAWQLCQQFVTNCAMNHFFSSSSIKKAWPKIF